MYKFYLFFYYKWINATALRVKSGIKLKNIYIYIWATTCRILIDSYCKVHVTASTDNKNSVGVSWETLNLVSLLYIFNPYRHSFSPTCLWQPQPLFLTLSFSEAPSALHLFPVSSPQNIETTKVPDLMFFVGKMEDYDAIIWFFFFLDP